MFLALILILLFSSSIIFYFRNRKMENFDDNLLLLTHSNYPFNNYQIGRKKFMSYDLRGDVPIINDEMYSTIPWNVGTSIPIYNKPLSLVY